jgi:3,4-dihydroxy 2-butanone 4-phosphate synthase/GTP cyclohydrolase II
VDLVRMAGLNPAAVIVEILTEDGRMARGSRLTAFARRHKLKLCRVSDVIAYRRRKEKLVTRTLTLDLPTETGPFTLHVYRTPIDNGTHLALCKGWTPDWDQGLPEAVLVRVHSECLTGDALGSLRCDCGQQLRAAMAAVQREEKGVVLYLRQEGRGIGLENKLKAYALQQRRGMDTVQANLHLGFKADEREYGIGCQILVDLGLRKIRVMTNNPHKFGALKDYGLRVVSRVPLVVGANPENAGYLRTKREKLGHLLR